MRREKKSWQLTAELHEEHQTKERSANTNQLLLSLAGERTEILGGMTPSAR